MKKTLISFLSIIFIATITLSCREKTAGEKVEDAVEDVGDAVEDGVEDVKDAVEDATDDN
ncbi:hypothetical protein [Aquimarina muelleri]|uniref:Entericidin EcnAB n=1 Tax=Aquimarina muelleri TaxID=279356 RepID=A0A918N1R6_9FLAO|nr:hypothetical protein [Aquimarina muelleri]MCX2764361.1 hypothetical protein [Aquimarina muelleri]GGX04893.1 hypothetical protein GCM10007384_03160 [Aquimarina muelleri]